MSFQRWRSLPDGVDPVGTTRTSIRALRSDGQNILSALLDSVVEDWEDGSDALDGYEYPSSQWTVTQSDVIDGDYALALDGDEANWSDDEVVFDDGSGLENAPEKGDVISCLLRDPGERSPIYYFGVGGTHGDIEGYGVRIHEGSNDFEINKFEDGDSQDIASTSQSISSGDWYDVEVWWHDGSGSESDNTIEAKLYSVDEEELERDEEITSISGSDSDFEANNGIAFGTWSGGSSLGASHDSYRIMGRVDSYDNPQGII